MQNYENIVQNLDLSFSSPFVRNVENDWTEDLFGFTDDQKNPNNIFKSCKNQKERVKVLKNFNYSYENGKLYINSKKFHAGHFFLPSVHEIVEFVNKNIPKKRNYFVDYSQENIESAIYNSKDGQIFQTASQFNALEMMDQNHTIYDGITNYIYDNTQGPSAALCCAPSLFIRNYHLPKEYLGQINALENFSVSHTNGYLIWGNKPEDYYFLTRDSFSLKIPFMSHCQVAGVVESRENLFLFSQEKFIHQIFCSSIPINRYGNGGDIKIQEKINQELIYASYVGTIGLGLILNHFDKKYNLTSLETPIIDCTLLGAGVFNVSLNIVFKALEKAIKKFSKYNFELRIHCHNKKELEYFKMTFKDYQNL